MSIMKPPLYIRYLDQSQGYHLLPHPDNWSIGIVCGVLEKTGKTVVIYTATLHELKCQMCGEITEVSNYDKIYIGKDSDLGESW